FPRWVPLVWKLAPGGRVRVRRWSESWIAPSRNDSLLAEVSYRVAEQLQTVPFCSQTLTRPARMLFGQNMPFGMRHEAQHSSADIANTSHASLRPVRVDRVGSRPAVGVDVAQHDLSCLLKPVQDPWLTADKSTLAVRHRHVQPFIALQKDTLAGRD